MSRKKTRTKNISKWKATDTSGHKREPIIPSSSTRGGNSTFYDFINHWVGLWLPKFASYLHQLLSQEKLLANILRKYILALIGNTVTLLIFTLVGLNSPASSSPLFTIIHQHQILSVIIVVVLSIYLMRVLFVGNAIDKEGNNKKIVQSKRWHLRSSIINSSLYTGSFSFLVMLLLVLVRPAWCPIALCPRSQLIPVTHPGGVHDDNLELYVIAIQSTSYVISGDLTHSASDSFSKSIGALAPDGQNSTSLYHLVLGLQSLQQKRFGLTIEKVEIVVQQLSPIPNPLNVKKDTLLINYENNNQYRAVYSGQETGSILPTTYLRFKDGFVHLDRKEADQIDIHVVSRVEANIKFSVQLIYRVDNESVLHTLVLPQIFEIIFARSSEWHLYHR